MQRPTAVRRAIVAHLGSRQVARVIYGAIIGMAVIVALQAHPPDATEVAVALAGTAVAVGLAELYSEVVGAETRTHGHIAREQLRDILDDVVAVGFGIAFPAVFFVLAALGAMTLDTAFTAAKWSGVGLIAFYGFSAARLAGARLPIALLHACAVAAIGAALIALKALVH
jgi:hypothetical protein